MDHFDIAAREVLLRLEQHGVFIPPEKRETILGLIAILLRQANHAITREQQLAAASQAAEPDGAQ